MNDGHVYELIPEYALGVLDEADQFVVIEHLKVCKSCRSELEGYRRVVDELPMAMQFHQPPEHLKQQILSKVKIERPEKETSKPNFWLNLRQVLLRSAPVWGTAGFVLLMILALSNLFLWQRLNQLEEANQHELISIALLGTESSPNAVGMLVMSSDGDYGVLVSDGLPVLSVDQQYQLWLIRDGVRTSGGVFSVNQQGYGNLVVASNQPLTGYDAFGVTVEPAGGSPGPTGAKVLGSDL
jgi:anti-sigma-K factor RskA